MQSLVVNDCIIMDKMKLENVTIFIIGLREFVMSDTCVGGGTISSKHAELRSIEESDDGHLMIVFKDDNKAWIDAGNMPFLIFIVEGFDLKFRPTMPLRVMGETKGEALSYMVGYIESQFDNSELLTGRKVFGRVCEAIVDAGGPEPLQSKTLN